MWVFWAPTPASAVEGCTVWGTPHASLSQCDPFHALWHFVSWPGMGTGPNRARELGPGALLGNNPSSNPSSAARRKARGSSLPVGCHLQAEASLHLHEVLIVPQPVGHGQGEGCLLVLQVGNRTLQRTQCFLIRRLELSLVELKVPTVRDTEVRDLQVNQRCGHGKDDLQYRIVPHRRAFYCLWKTLIGHCLLCSYSLTIRSAEGFIKASPIHTSGG